MKKTLILSALSGAILCLAMSCTGNTKEQPGSDAAAPEKVEAEAPARLDLDKINAMKDKKAADMTSSDYDFLLDQLESIFKPTEGMTKKERKQYISGLDKDVQGAMLFIGLTMASAHKAGTLSERQTTRFTDMEKRYE